MPDEKPKKRAAPISYRPPVSLQDEFHDRVRQSGLSISAFITRAVFGKAPPRAVRRGPVEQQLLARILVQAAAISAKLGERGSGHNADEKAVASLAQIHDELCVIRAALLKSMGRKP